MLSGRISANIYYQRFAIISGHRAMKRSSQSLKPGLPIHGHKYSIFSRKSDVLSPCSCELHEWWGTTMLPFLSSVITKRMNIMFPRNDTPCFLEINKDIVYWLSLNVMLSTLNRRLQTTNLYGTLFHNSSLGSTSTNQPPTSRRYSDSRRSVGNGRRIIQNGFQQLLGGQQCPSYDSKGDTWTSRQTLLWLLWT